MNVLLLSKYFWGFNKQAIKETAEIINNPYHPKFTERMIVFLSRCDKPKELFSIITKKQFMEGWPRIQLHWVKYSQQADFKAWWESIYEQLAAEYKGKVKTPKGQSLDVFTKIGGRIREARVEKGLSQNDLALKTGIEQPDVSKIEKGQKNITLVTLIKICKVLKIDKIELQ